MKMIRTVKFRQMLNDCEIIVIHDLKGWHDYTHKILYEWNPFNEMYEHFYGRNDMWEMLYNMNLYKCSNGKFKEIISEMKHLFIDKHVPKNHYFNFMKLPMGELISLVVLIYLRYGINILQQLSDDFYVQTVEVTLVRIPETCSTEFHVKMELSDRIGLF